MNYIYTLKSYQCNKHCPYCITKILNGEYTDDVDKFQKFIDELSGEYEYFILSGNGEPSLYKYSDLKNIRDIVESSGKFKNYRIQTSGILFKQPKKLKLFDDWIKEITLISLDQKTDQEILGYTIEYFDLLEKLSNIRCNYVMTKDNFSNKKYVSDLVELSKKYDYVAIKLLDGTNEWISNNAVSYDEKDSIIKDLLDVFGSPVYNDVHGRYEWISEKFVLTMSYGKEPNHDKIQIREII